MIPEEILENAPLYVLGELDSDEHAAFEAHLARSDELREEVRRCAEAFATLACGNAPAEAPPPHLWARIEEGIQPVITPAPVQPRTEVVSTVTHATPLWWSWGWPVAAALLLAFNLAQWFWPQALRRDLSPAEMAGGSDGAPGVEPAASSRELRTTGRSAIATAPQAPEGASSDDASATPELAEARARAHRLVEEYRRLAADYDELAETVIPLLSGRMLQLRDNGMRTVELLSRAGSETGATAGLWDRVQQIAPASGLALLPDRWRLGSDYLFDPTPPGTAVADGVATMNPPMRAAPPPDPFAVAVLNNNEGLGYLDLYNLPEVPAELEMRLWLQNENGTGYSAVGAVPRVLAGGSGGLVFRIPDDAGRAARVLITIEPVAPTPQPSGPVVIEGP